MSPADRAPESGRSFAAFGAAQEEDMSASPSLPRCFRPYEDGRFVMYLRAGFEDALADLMDPLATLWRRLERATPVARGRGNVAIWPLSDREERVVLRRYAHGGILGGLLGHRFWGMSRPIRELAITEYAREGKASVPLALGAVIERLTWPTCRAVFVTAEVPAAEDLVHFCFRMGHDSGPDAAREKRRVLAEVARQVRALHDAGIEHADLHLKNLLLHDDGKGGPRVALIDLDGSRPQSPGGEAFRLRNLMRLARSLRKLRVARAAITPTDGLRFVREYLRGQRDAAQKLRAWWPRLARSGTWHEVWWLLTGADRDLRGDRSGRRETIHPL